MSSIIGLPIKVIFPTSNNILMSKYKETLVEIAEKKHVTKARVFVRCR